MKEYKKDTVMFFCNYASLYSGNFIASIMAIENSLSKIGVKCVYVFNEESRNREWVQKLRDLGRTIDFFTFGCKRIKMVKNLLKLINKYNITILHTHFCFVLGTEIISVLRHRLKIFIHIHSDFTGGKRTFKDKIINQLLFKYLSFNCKFICVSKRYATFNPKKSYYLPNALAQDRLPTNHLSGDSFRNYLGINNDEILVEIFGWSPYIKGIDIAVKAIGKLNCYGIKIDLMIVCGRDITKQKMIDYINETTEYSGQEPFLYYVEPIEDVFCYHQAADICLSASRSETFSYALLEMLSIGKMCVVSDIDGTKWSTEYKNTFSFETENVASCVEAIKRTISKLTIKKIDVDVMEKVRRDYNIDCWVKSIIELYGF